MKNRLLLLICILFLLCGCSVITITDPMDGKIFKYRRLGTQAIRGFRLVRTPDGGFIVEFKSLESDSGKLGEAAADTAKTAVKLTGG